MAEMDFGCGGINPELHTKFFSGKETLFEIRTVDHIRDALREEVLYLRIHIRDL